MKVLGIDPSLNNFGFILAELDFTHDTIVPVERLLVETKPDNKNKKRVRKNSDDLERCRSLVEGLQFMQKKADVAFIEMPVGSQSARAMASYGFCIGVLAGCDIPMIQLTPYEVKLAAVGSKTATKQEMIDWAQKNHPTFNWFQRNGKMTLKNEHLADALAAIHAGVATDDFKAVINIYKHMSKNAA